MSDNGYPVDQIIAGMKNDTYGIRTANHIMTEGGIWIPQRGSDDGSVNTQVTGSIIEYCFIGNGNKTETFDSAMNSISVINDGDNDLRFEINDIEITVKPDEIFDGKFDPFTQVKITASDDYRVVVKS